MISVIIPTYNRLSVLPRAIDSVLNQTFLDIELIIVDDGSTDKTSEVIRSRYPKVICVRQNNSGVSSARNVGIDHASGEWIALLDSDDEWFPEKLSVQIRALKNDPEMNICHTNETWIHNGSLINQKKKHEKFGGWIFQKCLPLCCISPSSVLVKKSIFKKVGLFDESLQACEDYDMWLKITARNPVLYIKDSLIKKYGGHDDQLSKKYWGMDRFRIKALKNIINSGVLSVTDDMAARKMLNKKVQILINGSEKRGKTKESMKLKEQYSKFL